MFWDPSNEAQLISGIMKIEASAADVAQCVGWERMFQVCRVLHIHLQRHVVEYIGNILGP